MQPHGALFTLPLWAAGNTSMQRAAGMWCDLYVQDTVLLRCSQQLNARGAPFASLLNAAGGAEQEVRGGPFTLAL